MPTLYDELLKISAEFDKQQELPEDPLLNDALETAGGLKEPELLPDDPVLEQKGIVMEYELANGDIFELKIKRAGARNTEWRKLYNQLLRPVEEENEAGKISESENHYMMAELYAKSCVIGWKGLKDAEGNEVPFSLENCLELFCFMPELLTKVINDCHERSNFAHKEKEATAKNS